MDKNLKEIELKKGVDTKHIVYKFENEKIKGNIKLKKTDISGNPLKGAEFALYDASDNQVGSPVTSDANGEVLFKDIVYGKYTIKETKAPLGYYRSNEVIEVEITEDDDTVEKDIDGKDLTVENRKIPPAPSTGGLEILKLGENGESLAGAVFELVQDGKVIYTSEPTDNNGKTIFNHISLGNYTLREKTAPKGYKLSLENIEISINVGGEVKTFEFINTKIKGSIKLTKVDEEGEFLEGAEFSLYDSDGELVGKASSNKNGVVTFTNIPYGEYTVTETKAPEGYELNDTVYNISIEDGTIVDKDIEGESLKIENIKIPADPIDPNNPDSNEPGDPTDPTDSSDPDSNETGDPTDSTDSSDSGSSETGDPSNPSDPKDPNKSGHSSDPMDSSKSKQSTDLTDSMDLKGKILAKTGINVDYFIPIGFAMILIGAAYIYRDKLIKR